MHAGQPEQSFLKFAKYCMIASGLWSLPLAEENNVLKAAYVVYSILVRTYFRITVTSLSIRCALTTLDYSSAQLSEETFQELGYIISLITVEVAATLLQRKRVVRLLNYIFIKENAMLASKDDAIVRNYLSRVQFCDKCNRIMSVFMLGAVTSIMAQAIWKRREVSEYNVRYNTTLELPLPFKMYYFNLDTRKHPKLVFVLNFLAIPINAINFLSTKSILYSFVLFAPLNWKQLNFRIRKISVRGDGVSSVFENYVSEHQEIIKFSTDLNDSVKYLILMEYLLDSLIVAMNSMQFITYDTEMLAVPLFCFSVVFVQVFVLAWGANELRVESSSLAEAIYHSPWYKHGVTEKKIALTMMIRAQRPLALTVGPFDAMTTQSGLAIMKASYSYVTLMRNQS